MGLKIKLLEFFYNLIGFSNPKFSNNHKFASEIVSMC